MPNQPLTLPALVVGLFIAFGVGVYVGDQRAAPPSLPGNYNPALSIADATAKQAEASLKSCFDLLASQASRCAAPAPATAAH